MVLAKKKWTRKGPKKGPRKSKAIRPSKIFTKKVKKIISGVAETKQAHYNYGNTLTNFNSGISGTLDMLQVIPNIDKGDDDNQRSGDQITAKTLTISGHIKLYPPTQVSGTYPNQPKISNITCRLMILSMKKAGSYDMATAANGNLTSLLRKGGTNTAFTGVISDLYSPINRELFTVHEDRLINLSQSYVFYPQATAQTSSCVAIDEKDSVRFFKKSLKIRNKIFRYDPTTSGGILPTNYGPFLVMGYVYTDGSGADTLNTQIGMTYISTLNYEDI